jgi:1-acyl-sn-glycerol-3-phosphate acyltransferase
MSHTHVPDFDSPAAPAAPQTPLLTAFPPLFKNRNFLLLWLAYVISALGDRIHFLVMLRLLENLKNPGLLPKLADGVTDNPLWHKVGTQETAQLNIMMLLPFLLIGPITGVIADRLPRRFVMVGADFARTVVVFIARTLFLAIPAASTWHKEISWMPSLSYAVLLLLVSELLLAIFSAFFSPARTALMPNLVHPDQLLRANSMTNAAGTIASLVGFILGALLVSWHLPIAMYIDAGTFLTSGILLLGMRGKAIKTQAISADRKRGFIREFLGGVRYLLRHRRAMQVIALMFLFWCCGAIILSGLTGIVTTKFHKDVDWFGYFLGLVGIGMMLGAASCSLARRGIPKEFGIAWAMVFVGVFFFLFSLPRNWVVALCLLIVAAFFGAIMLVSLDTLLQRIVPNFIRGRVMAVRDMIANVGLVGVAVPLAINPNIDNYILLVLRLVAGLVFVVGIFLIIYYYRRQALPWKLAIAQRVVRFYLGLFKRFDVANAGRIPLNGPVIFVANHTTAYDPVCLAAASRYRHIQFMMAKEYYEKKPLNYLLKMLKVIPVNRTGNDTASVRTAIRALNDGGCIGMFPEGGISDDGRLLEGKQGVALLALMSGATVVPGYILGTKAHQGMLRDFLSRDKITFYFGRPIRFDDLGAGKRDEAVREAATRRIMDEIIRLRDTYETNPDRRISSAEWAAANPEEAAKFRAKLKAEAEAKQAKR